jgi:hypothetical protein
MSHSLRSHHEKESPADLSAEAIALIQNMFADEASKVIGTLSELRPDVRAVALSTLSRYNGAMAANDERFLEPIRTE